MVRFRLVAFSAIVALLLPISVNAAQPVLRATSIPAGIDATVLSTPTSGPIVATGTLKDGRGVAAGGTVAVVAWPSQAANHKLTIGSVVVTPTVGWASAGSDGAFVLRVDPSLVSADYRNTDGGVNLQAIGWTAGAQGSWSFPAALGTAGAGTLQAAAVGATTATPAITVRAASPMRTASTTTQMQVSPEVVSHCWWVLQSTYDAPVVVGYAWPYGADTGWMKSSSSHSETVGVATSATGAKGSWSVSGATSTSSAVTFTWAESVAYRDFRDEHRYGTYRYDCDGYLQNSWLDQEMYGTGGYSSAYAANPGFSYSCPGVSAGLWTRDRSDGNHLSLSGGVLISGSIGINLSVDTNWDTAHTLYYRLVANGKVCGDNNVPALASRVRTSR